MNADHTFPAREDASVLLKPFNEATAELLRRTKIHVESLQAEAETYQAQLNKIHKSKFNPHNLFTGFTYSQRCQASGP